jgi:primosomal replication protein N
LQARLVERAALRFTPAGLPALDLVLEHESLVQEAGHPRHITLTVKAKVMGEGMAQKVQAMSLGTLAQFKGFVASARNGKGFIFHITELH